MDIHDLKRRVMRVIQKLAQKPIVISRGEEMPMPGAFLVGLPRSGTTLLRYLFDSHPQVAAPPETFLFIPLLSGLKDHRSLHGMWHLGFHRETIARALGDCGRGFMEAYAKSKDKSFWVEKTPRYVDILNELHEAFGDIKFVMLYRHPFDIVQSLVATGMAKNVTRLKRFPDAATEFEACCLFVSAQIYKMAAFQNKHADICFEMRYDRVAMDPEPELRAVCDFLGLDFYPAMLDFQAHPHDAGLGDEKIFKTGKIAPRVNTYESWSADQRKTAAEILRKHLKTLGYDF